MGFRSLPASRTYIDCAQVTDPERERLEVVLENGETVRFRLTPSPWGRMVLELDYDNTDPAIINQLVDAATEGQAQTMYRTWYRKWRRQPRLGKEEVRHNLEVRCQVEDGSPFDKSPQVGELLMVMAGTKGGGATGTAVSRSPVATIVSITLPA